MVQLALLGYLIAYGHSADGHSAVGVRVGCVRSTPYTLTQGPSGIHQKLPPRNFGPEDLLTGRRVFFDLSLEAASPINSDSNAESCDLGKEYGRWHTAHESRPLGLRSRALRPLAGATG